MKYIVKESIIYNGKRYEPGDSINLPADKVENFLKKEWVSKESKVVKETKEFKKKSIETKDNASN